MVYFIVYLDCILSSDLEQFEKIVFQNRNLPSFYGLALLLDFEGERFLPFGFWSELDCFLLIPSLLVKYSSVLSNFFSTLISYILLFLWESLYVCIWESTIGYSSDLICNLLNKDFFLILLFYYLRSFCSYYSFYSLDKNLDSTWFNWF